MEPTFITPLRSTAAPDPSPSRKSAASWVLSLIIAAAITSCATQPRVMSDTGPGVIFEETPEPTAAAPAEAPGLSHLEGNAFPIASGQSVVGTLGVMELREGDTLPDVARHFGLGYEEIVTANPQLDPWVIPDGAKALVPVRFVLPKAPQRGVVINLAALRLFYYPARDGGSEVVTYPVGIGKEGRSTPMGFMSIARKKVHPTWRPTPSILSDHLKRGDPLPAVVPPGPDNPLGDYAMYLSAPRYLIHGTNKPYSVGLRASNGCIRLYPEHIERLFPEVPVSEPVTIVNQPYLVGMQDGIVYLQAYRPHEEVNQAAARERVRSELRALEAESGQSLDWQRIERILTEERAIPFPISATASSVDTVLAHATRLAHPKIFFGQPLIPPEDQGGWHVIAADTASEMTARRMAGIMNHQGPPIPARVLLVGERYQVVTGPFADAEAAAEAARRLRVDLELDGRIVSPDTQLAGTSPPKLPPSAPEVRGPESPLPEVPPRETVEKEATPAGEAYPEESPIPEATPPEPVTAMPETPPPETAPSEPAASPEPPSPAEEPYESPMPAAPAEEVAPNAAEQNPPENNPPAETEPLDLSVPEEFSEPSDAKPSNDATLEAPPDMDATPEDSGNSGR